MGGISRFDGRTRQVEPDPGSVLVLGGGVAERDLEAAAAATPGTRWQLAGSSASTWIEDPWEAFEGFMRQAAALQASDRALSQILADQPDLAGALGVEPFVGTGQHQSRGHRRRTAAAAADSDPTTALTIRTIRGGNVF